MATLVLSAVGTAIGGPLGGAIGALVGQQIDRSVLGRGSSSGTRLKDLSVTTSTYGTTLPRIYGAMRTAGTVIWATDLQEHSDKQGGKGQPGVTTYTYSSSFAIALSSRPILRVGRIWADGKLVQGAAGDSKTGSQIRVYTGAPDQPVDPLLAQAEGAECPAYRNQAYVVFEDLPLADYGNRIPSLTFEVFADEGEPTIVEILGDIVPDALVSGDDQRVAGYSAESGTRGDELSVLGQVIPVRCGGSFDALEILVGDLPMEQPMLLPATVPGSDSDDLGPGGLVRERAQRDAAATTSLRYYEVARDYQTGLQRARGRAGEVVANQIDFPAALSTEAARALVDRIGDRQRRAADRVRCRIGEIDPALGPGDTVLVDGINGNWRIASWEWQDGGVDLTLEPGERPLTTTVGTTDAGRSVRDADVAVSQTVLHAFELPWDGIAAQPRRLVAAGGTSSGWRGAALYAVGGDGAMLPIGSSGRTQAITGTVLALPEEGSPLVFQANQSLVVQLASDEHVLAGASLDLLATGANLALVGDEVIQFAEADRIGIGQWRLAGLLRGRMGTEFAVATHAVGDAFTLLDDKLQALGSEQANATAIAGLGVADTEPVVAPITGAGVTARPLSPVHGRLFRLDDGGVRLEWLRRARGGWTWLDLVEVPLNEEREAYQVTFVGSDGVATHAWSTEEPALTLTAADLTDLSGTGSGFAVCQAGRVSISRPLFIPFA